jgi:hypothetical protein
MICSPAQIPLVEGGKDELLRFLICKTPSITSDKITTPAAMPIPAYAPCGSFREVGEFEVLGLAVGGGEGAIVGEVMVGPVVLPGISILEAEL